MKTCVTLFFSFFQQIQSSFPSFSSTLFPFKTQFNCACSITLNFNKFHSTLKVYTQAHTHPFYSLPSLSLPFIPITSFQFILTQPSSIKITIYLIKHTGKNQANGKRTNREKITFPPPSSSLASASTSPAIPFAIFEILPYAFSHKQHYKNKKIFSFSAE